jgi:hypothetical protein
LAWLASPLIAVVLMVVCLLLALLQRLPVVGKRVSSDGEPVLAHKLLGARSERPPTLATVPLDVARRPGWARWVLAGALEFLVEALAVFEMTQRGFTELASTDQPGRAPTQVIRRTSCQTGEGVTDHDGRIRRDRSSAACRLAERARAASRLADQVRFCRPRSAKRRRPPHVAGSLPARTGC